jgi:hypothetical protein
MTALLVRFVRIYEQIEQQTSEGETKVYVLVFMFLKHPIEFLVSGEHFFLTDRIKQDSGAGF